MDVVVFMQWSSDTEQKTKKKRHFTTDCTIPIVKDW